MVILFCTDEKEKYDSTAFRDSIVQGLTEAQGDIEQVGKATEMFSYYRFTVIMHVCVFCCTNVSFTTNTRLLYGHLLFSVAVKDCIFDM